MGCEYLGYERRAGVLAEICLLNERLCFVEQPHTITGRQQVLSCARRLWALEHPWLVSSLDPSTPADRRPAGGTRTT